MSPLETNNLRLEVKAKLAVKDMDKPGMKLKVARMLSERTGRPISSQSLTMALSGYRVTEAYGQILTDLKAMLEDNSGSENIHVNQELQ